MVGFETGTTSSRLVCDNTSEIQDIQNAVVRELSNHFIEQGTRGNSSEKPPPPKRRRFSYARMQKEIKKQKGKRGEKKSQTLQPLIFRATFFVPSCSLVFVCAHKNFFAVVASEVKQ
jgi:hypothetical protein